MLASDLQLGGSLPASVAMLAIFQLIQIPASVLQLAGSLPAPVAMLAFFFNMLRLQLVTSS